MNVFGHLFLCSLLKFYIEFNPESPKKIPRKAKFQENEWIYCYYYTIII